MSTGTGIFLAGLIIGLVMLYGQTKDRWNWKKISSYVGIAIVAVGITIYHALNDWKVYEYDWTMKGMVSSTISFFVLILIIGTLFTVVSKVYFKFFNQSFEYDEEGNERFIFKFFWFFTIILFWILYVFYFEIFKEFFKNWIFG